MMTVLQVGGNTGQRSGLKTQVSDSESQVQEAGGELSAPEEEEDDFWG